MKLPPSLSWLWAGWMAFSKVLGIIMSTIILTVFWIVGIGIYGIIQKIIMLFSKNESRESYWLDAAPDYPESLKHQF